MSKNQNQLTPDQLNALVQYASKKLNTTPQELAKTVQSGGTQSLLSKLSPADASRVKAAVGNEKQIEQLLQSPQAKALIEQLLKKP